MQTLFCFSLIFIIGFSGVDGNRHRVRHRPPRVIVEFSLDPLGVDEAHLILSNRDYSENVSFQTVQTVCEKCDFQEIADVAPGSDMTLKTDRTFPFNIQLRGSSSKKILQCPLTYYNFLEDGTYLFEVFNTDSCLITQILLLDAYDCWNRRLYYLHHMLSTMRTIVYQSTFASSLPGYHALHFEQKSKWKHIIIEYIKG